MSFARDDDDWSFLARKTRRRPLIYGQPVLESTPEGIELRQGAMRWLGLAAVLFGLGFALGPLGVLRHTSDAVALVFVVVFGLIGLAALVAGLRVVTNRSRVELNRRLRECTIVYERMLTSRTAVAPLRQVSVRLDTGETSSAISNPMRAQLLLEDSDRDEPICVAAHTTAGALEPACHAMILALGGRPGTTQMAAMVLPDGSRLPYSTAPCGQWSASFQTLKLDVTEPDVALFRPSAGLKIFYLIFLAFGIMPLAMGVPGSIREGSIGGIALTGGIGVLFTAVGGIGFAIGFGTRSVVADRRVRTVVVRKGLDREAFSSRSWAFDDIAALQICCGLVEGDSGYTAYELNLVLANPPGERHNLFSHGSGKAVREDGAAFAAFIGKPLLDHS